MSSLSLDGVGDYALEAIPNVKFRLTTFTIECWIRIGESGKPSNTTDSPQPYPIVVRGTNYYLGVDSLTMRAFARYTDTGAVTRQIYGVRTLDRGVWYHLAVTRDATALRVYVNGELESILWCPAPSVASTLPVAIGTNWNGTSPAGFFQGEIRNLRIWDTALLGGQLRARAGTSASMSIVSSCVDELLLNAVKFTTVGTPTIDASVPGFITGTLPVEAHATSDGLSFTHTGIATIESTDPPFLADEPGTPSLVSPADMATPAGSTVALQATVTDRDGNANTIEFWGRNWRSHTAFSLAMLPDTQVPVKDGDLYVLDGFQWLADNYAALGIKLCASQGDCVDNPLSVSEWDRYSRGVDIIDLAGLPNIWCVGNHDRETLGTAVLGNTYFGIARYTGRPYYLGYFGSNNNNNAIRVQVASTPTTLYTTVISLEYDALLIPGALAWARSIAQSYPNDLIVVVSHYLITTLQPGFRTPLLDALLSLFSDLPNVRLYGCGHMTQSYRVDVVNTVPRHTIMSDYQFSSGSNRFYVRLWDIDPRAGTLRNRTRDCSNDIWRVEPESEFTLPFELPGYPAFAKIGEVPGVAAGMTASFNWSGLTSGLHYEWFARARNGNVYRDSARRGFTVA